MPLVTIAFDSQSIIVILISQKKNNCFRLLYTYFFSLNLSLIQLSIIKDVSSSTSNWKDYRLKDFELDFFLSFMRVNEALMKLSMNADIDFVSNKVWHQMSLKVNLFLK